MEFAPEDVWFAVPEPAYFDTDTTPVANGILMQDLGYDFMLPDIEGEPGAQTSIPTPQSSSNLWQSGHSLIHPPPKSRVSLACVPCRSRHAKCDAGTPTCFQCRESSRNCSYAASRRRLGKVRRKEHRQRPPSIQVHSHEGSRQPSLLEEEAHCIGMLPVDANLSGLEGREGQANHSDLRHSGDLLLGLMPDSDELSIYLDTYYTFFHAAHPFVLPQLFMSQRLHTDNHSLHVLLQIMEFVGSLYVPDAAKKVLRARAESSLALDDLPADGFTVQGLLIFAIALHSCNEYASAREILDRAIQRALQMNLQSKSFSIENSEGCLILAESWRRTWWFLYITDSIFASIRHCSTFALCNVKTSVDLPCEEALYESGKIPSCQRLEEYEIREFAADELVFSSFAYLIDLALITGSVLALGTRFREPFDPEVIGVDARFVNWISYLPKEKHRIINDAGKIDQIMFQAHMGFNTLKVVLHRPLSQLSYSPVESTSKCAPPPSEELAAKRQRAYDFHTTKVLEAAEASINLLTLPGPFTAHTPLIICGITLCVLAEISACRYKLEGPAYTTARNRVRLGLAASKAMGEVWTIGANTVKELQHIARETLSLGT